MHKKIASLISTALLICCFAGVSLGASFSPNLSTKLAHLSDSAGVGVVIVAFTTAGLNNSHLDVLRSVGISNGVTLQNLGMVAVIATVGQVKALAMRTEVRSIWSNDRLKYMMNQARVLASRKSPYGPSVHAVERRTAGIRKRRLPKPTRQSWLAGKS